MSRLMEVKSVIDLDDKQVQVQQFRAMTKRWDADRGYKMYHNRKSISGIGMLEFPRDLTKHDVGCLAILSRYLVGESNMLGYRGNKGHLQVMTPHTNDPAEAERFVRLGVDLVASDDPRILAALVAAGN